MNDDNNEDNEDDADAKPVLLHVGRDKQGGAPHRRPPIRCPGYGLNGFYFNLAFQVFKRKPRGLKTAFSFGNKQGEKFSQRQ